MLSLKRRTLIHGDKKGGFTVFWADDGLDTGPILLQRECDVEPNDTVNTIYKRFLFPEGVMGTVSADCVCVWRFVIGSHGKDETLTPSVVKMLPAFVLPQRLKQVIQHILWFRQYNEEVN